MNTLDDFIGPINLGNPSEISMLELAEKILKITHSKSKVVFKPLPQDDPVKADVVEFDISWKLL